MTVILELYTNQIHWHRPFPFSPNITTHNPPNINHDFSYSTSLSVLHCYRLHHRISGTLNSVHNPQWVWTCKHFHLSVGKLCSLEFHCSYTTYGGMHVRNPRPEPTGYLWGTLMETIKEVMSADECAVSFIWNDQSFNLWGGSNSCKNNAIIKHNKEEQRWEL